MKPCLRCRTTEIPADLMFCAECCGPELRIPFTTRPKPDAKHAFTYSEDADVAAAWRADLADYRPTHRAGRHARPYRSDHEHIANAISVVNDRSPKRRAQVAA